MTTLRLAGTLAILGFSAACGGGGDAAVDAAPSFDGAPDARPDAQPIPDARNRFECLGDALPTAAANPVVVSSGAYTISLAGVDGVDGVTVDAFANIGGGALATATSDVNGNYALSIPTGGTPLDGYIRGQKATYLDNYLYPPVPLTADTDIAPVLMVMDFTGINFLVGETQNPANGLVGVVVLDCFNEPIEGATVTSTPAGTNIYYTAGGIPSSSATATGADGLAIIYNVTAGNVVVDATAGIIPLREHTVNARANTVTTTGVQP